MKLVDISVLLKSSQKIDAGQSLGEITETKREVRRRTQDSLVWEESKHSQKLFSHDSILTLDQSTASVKLIGDTQITLNENTLVTIEPPNLNTTHEGPIR